MKQSKSFIIGDDGDKEVVCEHGVGHSSGVHTCEGCCLLCLECLGTGHGFEGFDGKEVCYGCMGTGVIIKPDDYVAPVIQKLTILQRIKRFLKGGE